MRRRVQLVGAICATAGVVLLLQVASRPWIHDMVPLLFVIAAVVVLAGRVRLITARAALAEQRLAAAQEDTQMGVFELDFADNTAFVSPSLAHMLGRPAVRNPLPLDEWLGELDPKHVAESRKSLEDRAARGELRYEREQRVALPDGNVRWLLSRVRMELGAGGRLAVARGATVDITERKRVDEELLRTQSDLRQQVRDMQRLHDFSQDLAAAGNDLTLAMRTLLKLMLEIHAAVRGTVALRGSMPHGLDSVAELIDTQCPRDAPSAVAPSAVAPSADAPSAGAPSADAPSRAAPHEIEQRLLSAAGELLGVITLQFFESPVWTERDERLSRVYLSMAASAVERARTRALAADRERLAAVALESAEVPFCILAPVRAAGGVVDLRWTYLNPAAARIFGRSVGELSGLRVTEVLPRNWEAPGLLERFVSVIDAGRSLEFETESVHQPGRWLHVIAAPLQGAAAVWFADISERKRDEAERRDGERRKDEFLATLAHELRNPLAPIRQSIRVSRSPAATEAQKRWCHDVIERQVENMALLLEDLLDVSRISRGSLLLRRAPVTLGTVVDGAVETVRPLLDSRRHRLELLVAAPEVTLDVDRLRLAQVLGNLLANAAKYTDPGGHIRLQAMVNGPDLRISVRDDGMGLGADQMVGLFEMFAQAPCAVGRSQGGLGIGLSLSRSLVRLHGGEIIAASEGPGLGSEFTVTLPGAVLSAPPRADSAPRSGAPGLAAS